MSTNQSSRPDSGQILRHQYGISVAEVQTFQQEAQEQGETAVFAGYHSVNCGASSLLHILKHFSGKKDLNISRPSFATISGTTPTQSNV